MESQSRQKNWRWIIVVLVLALLPSLAGAEPYVVLMSGKRIAGTQIRAKSNGDIILVTAMGSQTFPKDQVRAAYADKPPEFDQARKYIAANQPDKAAELLKKIITQYRYLGWDVQAIASLAKLQLEQKEYRAAIDEFEKLFAAQPRAKASEAVWSYYEALLGAKQYAKLQKDMDQLVKEGDRGKAAKAQIVRGDIKAAQGKLDEAVLDYLRTVILFKAEKEHQPEALYKAGQMLAALRDKRSAQMYQTLDKEYPESEWKKMPRGK